MKKKLQSNITEEQIETTENGYRICFPSKFSNVKKLIKTIPLSIRRRMDFFNIGAIYYGKDIQCHIWVQLRNKEFLIDLINTGLKWKYPFTKSGFKDVVYLIKTCFLNN